MNWNKQIFEKLENVVNINWLKYLDNTLQSIKFMDGVDNFYAKVREKQPNQAENIITFFNIKYPELGNYSLLERLITIPKAYEEAEIKFLVENGHTILPSSNEVDFFSKTDIISKKGNVVLLTQVKSSLNYQHKVEWAKEAYYEVREHFRYVEWFEGYNVWYNYVNYTPAGRKEILLERLRCLD